MPNRTEARPAKAALTMPPGDYRYCACSRLYSCQMGQRCPFSGAPSAGVSALFVTAVTCPCDADRSPALQAPGKL